MRARIAVACGVLVDARGQVLVAQRPSGKIAAGRWEFPGGKIEPDESAHAALVRELHEELGIEVTQARPLIRIVHDYSDRTVVLDTWLIGAWRGEPQSREGQAFQWLRPERLWDVDLLEADGPIVNALKLPAHYVFTPPGMTLPELLQRMQRLPQGALLRLRLPQLDAKAYEAVAVAVIERGRALGLSIVLDREPRQVEALGAAGWHASVAAAASLHDRPVSEGKWFIGSAHNPQELATLGAIGADAAVLGPVQATASHPGQPALGWDAFCALATAANIPVYAIGGVGPGQLTRAQAAYGQGVAGISAYWDF